MPRRVLLQQGDFSGLSPTGWRIPHPRAEQPGGAFQQGERARYLCQQCSPERKEVDCPVRIKSSLSFCNLHTV